VKQFKINLKEAHEKTGFSPYAVAKQTGIAQNTVRKYVDKPDVLSVYIPTAVVILADFYHVDWRSPSIVEVVER